jgi:hypothetical protein
VACALCLPHCAGGGRRWHGACSEWRTTGDGRQRCVWLRRTLFSVRCECVCAAVARGSASGTVRPTALCLLFAPLTAPSPLSRFRRQELRNRTNRARTETRYTILCIGVTFRLVSLFLARNESHRFGAVAVQPRQCCHFSRRRCGAVTGARGCAFSPILTVNARGASSSLNTFATGCWK